MYGVQHAPAYGGTLGYRVSIQATHRPHTAPGDQDPDAPAQLCCWTPECGFEPQRSTHPTLWAAKTAGEAWLRSTPGSPFYEPLPVLPVAEESPELTEREWLDAFIIRAGFTYGWERLESWARRMAEQAYRERARRPR